MREQKEIAIEEAVEGMTVAVAVSDNKGNTLIPAEVELSSTLIDRLKSRDISTISVWQTVELSEEEKRQRIALLDERLEKRFHGVQNNSVCDALRDLVRDYLIERDGLC